MAPSTLTEGQRTYVKAQSTRESQLDGKGGLDLAGANLLGRELGGLDWEGAHSQLAWAVEKIGHREGGHIHPPNILTCCVGLRRLATATCTCLVWWLSSSKNAKTLIFLAVLSRIPVRRPVTPVPPTSRPRSSEPSLGGHDTVADPPRPVASRGPRERLRDGFRAV